MIKNRPPQQTGFTLVELVVVIVILGILTAVALPRFIDLSSEANIAVLESMGGSILTASNMAYAKAAIQGVQGEESATIDLDGDGVADVEIRYGYPTASRGPGGFSDPNNLFNVMESNFSNNLAWGTNFAENTVHMTTSNILGSSGGKVNNVAVTNSQCYITYTHNPSAAGQTPTVSYTTVNC
jgi:MSHA pilin protein MshA